MPERNPTGVYRRSFHVPAAWLRRSHVLHVGGAESVHAVYVNGEFAGYGTDSRLPSEYDITDLVRAGDERARHRGRSATAPHSYIEDQDQWWMAGLHRSVWIESRPTRAHRRRPVATDYDAASGIGRVAATTVVDFGGEPGSRLDRARAGSPTQTAGRSARVQPHPVPTEHARPYVFSGSLDDRDLATCHAPCPGVPRLRTAMR